MSEQVDLEYDPATLLGPIDRGQVAAFEDYLAGGEAVIKFDSGYLDHLSQFHGGKPGKRVFTTSEGREKLIERFLNFVKYKEEPELGWYNVEVTWGQIADRLGDFLIPFAALFGGDFLCFDYSETGRPRIVVWLHEESRESEPVTDLVASNFDDFLKLLRSL